MKVLFVQSGNSDDFGISPFIKQQGDSLRKEGVDIQYFAVRGKGIPGYLRAAHSLRRYLKANDFDLLHAHYTLSGWSAVLAFSGKPIVLSLMGSDVYGDYIGPGKVKLSSRYLTLLTYLIQPFVDAIICKSKHIESFVFLKKKSQVIPNGIILENFQIKEKNCKDALGLEEGKQHVLFLGSKLNIRKNYKLVEDAMQILSDENISLVLPYPVNHSQVIKYMNSVDCLVVPSFMEGSPNVVKEAMACNCPIVATNVGDVEWLFGNEPGHYLSGFLASDLANKIRFALNFSRTEGRTQGRKRIIQLGLEAKIVAGKIISIYKSLL